MYLLPSPNEIPTEYKGKETLFKETLCRVSCLLRRVQNV